MAETGHELPLARAEGLLTEEVEAEIVVYDSESKQAHCLSPLAALVFAGSDGQTPIPELAELASTQLEEPVEAERVEDALAQLEELGLMVVPEDELRVSRRGMIRKGALVGAAVAATPLIVSVATASAQTGSCAGMCDPNVESACRQHDAACASTGDECRCIAAVAGTAETDYTTTIPETGMCRCT